ncbi:MAG: methyltransferase domain-containing protein [Candidatus Coatesbacteria bacterium]
MAPWVREAFLKVPRHLFIDQFYDSDAGGMVTVNREHPSPEHLKAIYCNVGRPIKLEPHSAASEPWLVANMLGHLGIERGMRVLEIGTGSGFNAGLMTVGTGDPTLVHSVDIQPDLVEAAARHLRDAGIEGVNLRACDGGLGWPEAAPFDRIMLTVGSSDITPAWLGQLAENGVLLMPFKTRGMGDPLLRLRKAGGRCTGGFVGYSGFNALQGAFLEESQFKPGITEDDQVTRLLAEPPVRRMDLDGFSEIDFLLFCRSLGLDLEAAWVRRADGAFHLILDRKGDQALVMKWGEQGTWFKGNANAGTSLLSTFGEWESLGRPALTRYRAEVISAGEEAVGEHAWIERRSHVRLRFSLEKT